MPNGDDKNWFRACAAIDGFRVKYGRWPKRVRLGPIEFVNLVSHVLTPLGFALISSKVEFVPEDDAEMIAEDDSGATYNYGKQGFPRDELETSTRKWFGEAVLQHGLGG